MGNTLRTKDYLWELCGPAAESWDDPTSRADPYEIFRIAAIIMASGGKYCFGLPSQMDGALYPEPAENVALFGEWYKLRRKLFTEAISMKYKGENVPGINIRYAHTKNYSEMNVAFLMDMDHTPLKFLRLWSDFMFGFESSLGVTSSTVTPTIYSQMQYYNNYTIGNSFLYSRPNTLRS